MSRKPLDPDQRATKGPTFNSLVNQLEQDDSLVNYLPEDMKIGVLSVPEELVAQDELDLVKILKEKYRYEPTNTVEALRNNFWLEFDRASYSRHETIMLMSNVYLGVCSRAYFYKIFAELPHVLAYILTRPPEYEAIQAGLLSLSTRRIRDILSIPLMKDDKTYQDPKLIELVLKAAAMVDLRNKGGYLNRSETKNLTLLEQKTQVTTYTGVFDAASGNGRTVEQLQADIDKQLKQLEEEARIALPLPKVTSTPVDAVEAEYKEVDEQRPGTQTKEA